MKRQFQILFRDQKAICSRAQFLVYSLIGDTGVVWDEVGSNRDTCCTCDRIHLSVPWHNIKASSKKRGCMAPKDRVRYRRHSNPSCVQFVMLERRLRMTEFGVHTESKRSI